MKKILCVVLIAVLIMPPQAFGLAPESMYGKAARGRAAQDWEDYAASPEFAGRLAALWKAWADKNAGESLPEVLAREDAKLIQAGYGGCVSFDQDGYKVYSAGANSYYLRARVLSSDQKGKRLYMMVQDESGKLSGKLLDDNGFRQHVVDLLPKTASRALEDALHAYAQRERYIGLRGAIIADETMEKIELANENFAQAKLDKQHWLSYIVRTVGLEMPAELLPGILTLSQVLQLPVPDYFEQAFPEHAMGASEAREAIMTSGQRLFAGAPREFQAAVLRYVWDSYGISAQQEDWMRKLFFLGPLGPAGNLALYPYPAWAKDGEAHELMERALASSGMDYAMLRPTALSGYWDAYRPVFDGMQKEIASKTQMALDRMHAEIEEKMESDPHPDSLKNRAQGSFNRAVERIQAEAVFKLARRMTSFQEELQRLIEGINKTPGMPHVRKARVSSFITPGSAADVHPAVLQARQTIWALGVLDHNIKSAVSGAELSLSMLQDATPQPLDFRRWVGALKNSRKALVNMFETLRAACPSEEKIETLEQASALIYLVSAAITDCRRHALGMRKLFQNKLLPSALAAGMHPGQNRFLDIAIRKYATMLGEFDNFFDHEGELKNRIGSDRWINLGAILTKDLVRERWGENLNNIDVRVNIAGDVPDTFMDRNIILDHLITILVNNAGQAMGGDNKDNPTPGTLTITVRRHADGNQAELIVEDSGGGMPDEIMPHIFTLKFTYGKGEKGHGVGLDAAMAAVRRYGGSIKVDSTRGAGTRFTMVFPSRDTKEKGLAAQRGMMAPAQAAALAALPYVGDGAVEAVQRFAAEQARREMAERVNALNIRGTWIGAAKTEQPAGSGTLPVAILSNALEGQEGIVFGDSQGAQSIVAYAGLDDFLEVPDTVYLYSILVGEKAAGAGIDIYKPVQENLQRIADRLRIPVAEMKSAMLFKTRHYHLLREWLKAGMKAHREVNPDDEQDFQNFLKEIAGQIQDGKDFQSGNILFSSKTDVQLVHALYAGDDLHCIMGAADRDERLLSALYTWALGGEMMARPVSKDKLHDDVENADVLGEMADDFSRDEWKALRSAGILPNGATKKELLSESNRLKAYKVGRPHGTAGLVHASQYLMHTAGIRPSRWIKELQGIRVDPLTGDTTVSGLTVSSDNPPHTIEITYAGEYLEWEQVINDAKERGDTDAQVQAMAKYADALMRSGDYGNAVRILDNALSLAPSRHLAAKMQYAKGMQLLVHGRAKDQIAAARSAFAQVKAWDEQLYAGVSGLDDMLSEQPPDKRVHGAGYVLSYAPGTGRITLSLLDRQRDVYYDQHINAGIVLKDGRKLWTADYPGHTVETTPYRDHVEMAVHYHDAEAKDKPDIWVIFNFPNDRPYFTVRMKAQNKHGEAPVHIEEWTLMHSHAVTLGQEPGQTIAHPEFRPMGAWAHLVSRLGFGVAFTGWGQDGEIEHRQGIPASFRAMSKTEDLVLEPEASAGSAQLAVRVHHHPLNAAGGFALWDAIAALSKVPGAESERWPDFGQVVSSLFKDEQQSLISAAVMSKTGVSWDALSPHLPAFLKANPALLQAIRHAQATPVETNWREEPSLFCMDVPLGKGKAKLVALFNIFDHDTEWDLQLDGHLRLPGKEVAILDLWENKLLGAQAGGRISGNYKFRFQDGEEGKGIGEAIPLRGVKFLLVFDPDEGLPQDILRPDTQLQEIHSAGASL